MFHRFRTLLTTAAFVFVTATIPADAGDRTGNGTSNGKQAFSGKTRMFGKRHRFNIDDLPRGRMRSRLHSLPGPAWNRAMDWLHRFDFPEKDADSIIIDNEGAVLYADPAPTNLPDKAEPAPAVDDGLPQIAAASAAEDAFLLHSRPEAPNVVYLDFDGHSFTGTAWDSGTISAKPFDLDGTPSTFAEAEREAIAEIWHRVAEDFAAFDIDVTTEEPLNFGPNTGRILITSKTQTNGQPMPYGGYGGVAYVDVWGYSNYASRYSPALVFYDNLANAPTIIAEASAHEFGHNLGLSHDGNGSVTYYAGHGSGSVSWAPIMGNSYSKNVTQWSNGEYTGANNTQDDLAIITSKLFPAADDHGDTLNDATPLVVNSSGQILVSNPETDPHDLSSENKGIINDSSDIDLFSFSIAGGQVDLSVIPSWDAFYRSTRRGANLDIQMNLLNSEGALLVSSDPASETDASISINLPPGSYYLVVAGIGNGNYSDYASAGQYYISGTVSIETPNEPPAANFSFDCIGLSCSYSDSSNDTDGTIAAWSWDFGDGTNSTAQNPIHDYASADTYSVALTVTDDNGATALVNNSVFVTHNDTVSPVVTPPVNITKEATAILTPVTLDTAVVDDGSPISNNAPTGGFPLGTTVVTWSATDTAGNTGSATQSVTIVDTTPPLITAPAGITIASGGNIGTATASDIFPVTLSNDAPSSFPVGNTIVTWTATDTSGNTVTATQTITVNGESQPPPTSSIDFNSYSLSSFGSNQDLQGSVDIEDGGATLRLTGNRWQRINFPYSVTQQTILEFDFYSGTEGEIHGIGLEEDNRLSSN
ncbi:MAG: PKD domain-containing protein, partial [Gammaproteobacteria bacterium]|nr:PKD domain-containing protein [Gammaproteobacteria bacterium]